MSTPSHVFVSYVREDQEAVDRLAAHLRQAGVEVWLDREQIQPGQRWQGAIASAIENGAFFIACFSKAYAARVSSYVNEEITLAIDELRRRPTDRAWFIPVLLSGGTVPKRSIGGGETLRDLQWVDLDSDWNGGLRRLLAVVAPSALTADEIVDRLDLQPWSAAQWRSLVTKITSSLRRKRADAVPFSAIVGTRSCRAIAEALEEVVFTEARKHGARGEAAELHLVAQQIGLMGNESHLKFALTYRLQNSKPVDCDAYRLLAALPVARYLNTNFDELLSTALASQQRIAVREIRRPDGASGKLPHGGPRPEFNTPAVARPLVYHMFGHVDHPESLIVTDDDYRRFASESAYDHSPVTLDLLRALATGIVVIVGFRSQDRALLELLHFADTRRAGGIDSFSPGWFVQVSPFDEIRHLASRVRPLELLEASIEHCKALERHFTNRRMCVFWGTAEDFLSQLVANIEMPAQQ